MQIEKNIKDQICTFLLRGKFRYPGEVSFDDVLEVFQQENINKIIFDFSQLEFMDSFGLGVLFYATNEATEHGKEFIILNPNGNVSKLLEQSHADKVMKIEFQE